MSSAKPFPTGFDPSSSVLFLGSGFSVEATNIVGKNPPVGDGLRAKFLELLELDKSDESDLKDLAEYAFQNGKDVHRLLSDQFTISKVSDNQAEILAQPWRRVYTTNYDDAVECFHKQNRTNPKPKSYSNEEPPSRQVRAGSIIHIHGYIHRMTPENVSRQAVLSHRSYAEQAATTSPWWQQFERDIRSAENIFFVGYSLADFETASYLTQSNDLISKTHFMADTGKHATDPQETRSRSMMISCSYCDQDTMRLSKRMVSRNFRNSSSQARQTARSTNTDLIAFKLLEQHGFN